MKYRGKTSLAVRLTLSKHFCQNKKYLPRKKLMFLLFILAEGIAFLVQRKCGD